MRSLPPFRLPLLSTACVVALALTACSTENGSGTDPTERVITVWADDERAMALTTFAEAYSRTADARVEIIVVDHEELRASFLSTHTSGMGPDVLVGPHDWTGELAAAGAIAPVGLGPEDTDAFTPGALEAVTHEGRVYGVPYATENVALIRNTDLAPEAPETFEELVETGTALVRSGRAERVLSLQIGEEGDAYHLHPLFTSAGGYLFGEDGNGGPDPSNLGVASPESVTAFERLAELGEAGSGVLSREVDATAATDLFVSGAAPFHVTGPWSVAPIKEAGIPYAIGPVPPFAEGGPARPLIGVQTFFVSSGASDPGLAEEFASDFVADPAFSVTLYDADPRVPALLAALEQVAEHNPDLEAFQRAGEEGVPMPAIPEMDAVWGPFGQAGADIIGGADPASTLAGAEAQIRAGIE
ncbi:sugar ABC transporter substrate-binding protein [Nocardiopsis halotolerans]|uniref:sugar ABC transporter substrate-binding protein n=1 Tax=Nocardiopsis halotolerans TaxID=124252 RepID=UPI000348ECC2|nr:maltose ABC transporter substrate-binding protein [Nocardiopsis halotolerans]